MFQAVNVKFFAMNNHETHSSNISSDEKDYPLSNGSVAGTTNGDTENEESTEERSELDSSEIDDVSILFLIKISLMIKYLLLNVLRVLLSSELLRINYVLINLHDKCNVTITFTFSWTKISYNFFSL